MAVAVNAVVKELTVIDGDGAVFGGECSAVCSAVVVSGIVAGGIVGEEGLAESEGRVADIESTTPVVGVGTGIGVVVGDDAAQKLRLLREYRRSGQLLQYIGRNIFANVVFPNPGGP